MSRRFVESEHPRHPADSPGGTGGEFREKWIGRALGRVGFTWGQDILQVLHQGEEVGQTPLAGGETAETVVVEFRLPSGRTQKLVRKRSDSFDSDLEVLASAIGRAMGAPVPVVVQDPDDPAVIWMPLLDGDSAASLIPGARQLSQSAWLQQVQELQQAYVDTDGGRLLGLLDLVLRARDRHPGNWLVLSDGSVAGIDHTHIDTGSFAAGERAISDTGGPFAARYIAADRDSLVDNDWHPDDLLEIEKRLDLLFAREDIGAIMDRLDAEPEMFLSRLRVIMPRAKGTRRRLP